VDQNYTRWVQLHDRETVLANPDLMAEVVVCNSDNSVEKRSKKKLLRKCFKDLSEKEKVVANLIKRNYSTKEIAAEMKVRLTTVKKYKSRIKDKLKIIIKRNKNEQ
jgi:RNA polymerase sigma factor (sigma-70 family)